MARMPFLCVLLCVCAFVVAGMITACGDPNACNNDNDCTDGKICLHLVCATRPAETGNEPSAEPAPEDASVQPEPRPEPQPEPRPEPQPEPQPESVVKDQPKEEPGTRTEGNICDPRGQAYFYDRCAPGLACAEYAQTSPSSGAPQPYGICLKGCTGSGDTSCPSGTVCSETYDTKTRQGTGIFVCAREAKEGELCVNTDACGSGLVCTKFGTTGTNWTCQKDCTKDASVCGSNQKCDVVVEGSSDKICKNIAKSGEYCSESITCDDNSYCYEGNRYGAFAQLCRKRCSGPNDCASGESCQQLSLNGAPVASICLTTAAPNAECNRGFSCASGSQCLDLATTYSACFKRCNTDSDCTAPLGCRAISAQTPTKVCKELLQPGDPVQNLGDCRTGSRAISLASGVVVCLPSCSQGTGTNAALCGKLTPGTLQGVISHPSRGFITVGELGVVSFSSNGGARWIRSQIPTKYDLAGVAASGDGKTILAVGLWGTIIRSEDSGASWSLVSSGTSVSLAGVTLSDDGTTAIAVGPKGLVLRSEDGGKTWATVTVSGVTADLTAVSFARDAGTGTSVPLALIVGLSGTILRSEDAGKTWASVTGVTIHLRGLALLRDRAAAGPFGVLAGDSGEIWTSADEGKTWSKETSGVTTPLHGAFHDSGGTMVVGDNGVILQRDQSGMWTKLTSGVTLDLRAVSRNGTQWTAVGQRGTSVNSGDDGKTWAETGTQALQCVGITSGGAPAGGVCLFRCEGLAQGTDCPFGLNRCDNLNLGSTTVSICFPPTAASGTAGAGDPCTTYAGAPDNLRCKENHACSFVGTGLFCMRRCDDKLTCDAGDTCTYVNTLQGKFCGKTVGAGKVCDLATNTFCEAGHTCIFNRLTGQSVCEPVPTAKEAETCDSQRRPCEGALICSGLSSTPYRRFCTRLCTPGGGATGCRAGWDCLQTSPGNGICVERCSSPNHVCEAKHVRCQRVTSTNNSHCI